MDKTALSLEEFQKVATSFAEELSPRTAGATLVTLSGELGAGKTSFVKAAARTLGADGVVNSPTFVLEKIYKLPAPRSGAGFKRLVHIDAYRLESGVELGPLGFDELMKDAGNLVLLEWPEKVADALPKPTKHISLSVLADGSRRVSYDA